MKIVRYDYKAKIPQGLTLNENEAIWSINTMNFEVNSSFIYKEEIHFYTLSIYGRTSRQSFCVFSVWRPRGEDILFKDRIK